MSADLGALIQPLQPFAKALVDLGGRAGVQPRVTSTLRSHGLQQRLYDSFLRGESKYPVAPPGTSAHEFGYAFDMVADTPENLHDLGSVWKSWGGLWSPSDEVHFEYPGFVAANMPVDLPADQFLKLIPKRAGYVSQVCDFVAGKWWVTLLQLGWPQSEVLKLLAAPCSTILATLTESGILVEDR